MSFKSEKTPMGNIGFSYESQELADAQAAQMDANENKNCFNCSGCSRCSGCSDCSDCSGCSRCSGCSGCSDCSDCSGCSRCSRCSGCSGCSGCSDCSGCSRCSGCYDCSSVAYLRSKDAVKGDPDTKVTHSAPIVPVIENIHSKVYAAASQPHALDMDAWHTCETTHCRAGWVVALAGEAGKALEKFHDTPLAALLIYHASSPELRVSPPRFYENSVMALADMKRLADLEQAS